MEQNTRTRRRGTESARRSGMQKAYWPGDYYQYERLAITGEYGGTDKLDYTSMCIIGAQSCMGALSRCRWTTLDVSTCLKSRQVETDISRIVLPKGITQRARALRLCLKRSFPRTANNPLPSSNLELAETGNQASCVSGFQERGV